MTRNRKEGVPALRNDDVTGMSDERQQEVVRQSGRARRKDAAKEFNEEQEQQAGETSAEE